MTPALMICAVHWRPLRLQALQLAEAGRRVHLILRGPIVPDVLSLIPRQPLIHWTVIPRPCFKPLAFLITAVGTLTSRTHWIYVDRPAMACQLQRWIPWARHRCAWVRADATQGYSVMTTVSPNADCAGL